MGHNTIQSIEVGMQILRVLAERQQPMTLSELAKITGLFKSQLYRYLNTFVKLDILLKYEEQIPRWTLGPELIALGTSAFNSLDLTKCATQDLRFLREELNETVALSIWRDKGPFFLCYEKSHRLINVDLDAGSYVPLYTATGKIFRAFLPESVTDPLYRAEVAAGKIDPAVYDPTIETVRQTGLAVSKGSLVKGFVAMATPILDHQGLLVGALSIIGVDGSLDHEAESKPVQLLLQSGERISRKLGYKGRWPLLSPVAR